MEAIRINNGRIWDGERFLYGDIAVDGGIVTAIGNVGEFTAGYEYDAGGKNVLPGLVDIHTHLWGISTDRFGIPAELGCFPFGVTATAECGAEKGTPKLLERTWVKNVVFVCTQIRDNHAYFTETERLLKLFGDRVVGVKIYFDSEISEVRDATALREVCDFACSQGLKVAVHSSHSPVSMREIVETLSAGDILTHVYHGGVHSAAEDDFRCIAEAKKRGIIVDTGHAGYVHTDCDVLRKAVGMHAWPDTISTDLTNLNAYNRGGVYGLTVCMSLFRALGYTEEEMFRSVTSRAADAVGQHTWGRLAVGAPADIAVLEKGPVHYVLRSEGETPIPVEDGYRCVLTIADGRIVYQREK